MVAVCTDVCVDRVAVVLDGTMEMLIEDRMEELDVAGRVLVEASEGLVASVGAVSEVVCRGSSNGGVNTEF